jgi:hypothetical protein
LCKGTHRDQEACHDDSNEEQSFHVHHLRKGNYHSGGIIAVQCGLFKLFSKFLQNEVYSPKSDIIYLH